MDLLEPLPLDEVPTTVLDLETKFCGQSETTPVAKASALQIEYMVNYLYLHPYIVDKSFEKLKNPQYSTGSWEKLTNKLNNMWSRIVINDVKSWKAIWRQEQNKALRKLDIAMETNEAATGGVDGLEVNMTLQDLKILRLLHLSSVDKELTSAHERRGELSNTEELNGEQKKDVQIINLTDCTSEHSSDTESVGSFAGFDTLQPSADGIDDMEITMTFTNSLPDLGTVFEQLLQFEAPSDEPCPPSQQNPVFPAPRVAELAPPAPWQPWRTYPSSSAPAKIRSAASSEPGQTPSCEKSCNSTQWWSACSSSSAPAKVETPALAEPCETPRCEKQSSSVPEQVKMPVSCEVSHSLKGQQSPVRAKMIKRVTRSKRSSPRRLQNLQKTVATLIEQQMKTEEKIKKFLKEIADLEKEQHDIRRDDVSSSSSSDRT